MEVIIRRPRLLLASVGKENARKGAPTQAEQTTEGLAQRALKAASLREDVPPSRRDAQKPNKERRPQTPGLKGRIGHVLREGFQSRAKVLRPVRRKRSRRATRLERAETRLSLSIFRPVVLRMRARISLICSGPPPADLSMSSARST